MYRVMKTNEFKDSIWYRVACDCSDKDCDLTVEFEYDKDLNMIFLNIYKNLKWSSHWVDKDQWWLRFKKRMLGIFKIVFTGYVEIEETLILQDIKHIDSFIKALQDGKGYLSKNRED